MDVSGRMVGRRVVVLWERSRGVGTVVQWEPFTGQGCDALVRFEDGFECWFASYTLRPAPGDEGLPLPDLQKVREENDARTLASLEVIRVKFVREFAEPWPGAEFGKAIVGQAIDAAIAETKKRRQK